METARMIKKKNQLNSKHSKVRFTLYKAYVKKSCGTLTKGDRRELPGCVYAAIRGCFPDSNGKYVEFKESKEMQLK